MTGKLFCHPAGYSPDRAIELGNLVQQAYDQFVKWKNNQSWELHGSYDSLLELSAKPDKLPLTKSEPFGFVARSQASGDIYVVFRGTASPADWVANLSFPQTPNTLGGMVEEGFSYVYGQCSAQLIVKLRQLRAAGELKTLWVTGHSLGGALSTLCAADIAHQADLIGPQLYTFASPRTGNRDFATVFNSKCPNTWRTVNTEDIVNTVPLATAIVEILHEPMKEVFRALAHLGYEHVGTPVDFTIHTGSIIGNHQMTTYLDALKASMAAEP